MTSNMQAVDSLVANEFALEMGGEKISGVFRVTGLTTFKVDANGKRVQQPFEIAKMVQRDGNNAFNKWLRVTRASTESVKRDDIAVLAVDDGVETRRWAIKGAWIQEIRYSEFNSASFEMVEEIFVICYDSIEESWPTTPDLD